MDRRVDRACDECTLCCKLLGIKELDKPAQKRCEHVCETGCSIYPNRLHSCRRFECLWLKGRVPKWARPDYVGVVFDEARPKITGKTMPILVIEEFAGAHKQSVVELLLKLFQDREVYVVGPDNNPRRLETK